MKEKEILIEKLSSKEKEIKQLELENEDLNI